MCLVFKIVVLLLVSSNAYAFTAPALLGRVNDHASLLVPEQRTVLEGKLKVIEDKTTAQVVVLTVPNVQGMEVKDFALQTFTTWKLGQKDKNNGLLIMYVVEGDHSRIEVGYGLEGAIPDGKAGGIIRDVFRKYAPKQGSKDFNAAFAATVDAVSAIILAEYAKDPTGASMKGTPPAFTVVVILCLLAVVVVGLFDSTVGGIVGAVLGVVAALVGNFGALGILVFMALGALIGAVVRPLAEASGGGGSGTSGGFFDSGGGGGGFGGGGGCGGGGGAGD